VQAWSKISTTNYVWSVGVQLLMAHVLPRPHPANRVHPQPSRRAAPRRSLPAPSIHAAAPPLLPCSLPLLRSFHPRRLSHPGSSAPSIHAAASRSFHHRGDPPPAPCNLADPSRNPTAAPCPRAHPAAARHRIPPPSFHPRYDPPPAPSILASPSALDRVPVIVATINSMARVLMAWEGGARPPSMLSYPSAPRSPPFLSLTFHRRCRIDLGNLCPPTRTNGEATRSVAAPLPADSTTTPLHSRSV
jgi:hypothetical protein